MSPTDIIKHIHKSDNKILKQIVDNIIPELKKSNINFYFGLFPIDPKILIYEYWNNYNSININWNRFLNNYVIHYYNKGEVNVNNLDEIYNQFLIMAVYLDKNKRIRLWSPI